MCGAPVSDGVIVGKCVKDITAKSYPHETDTSVCTQGGFYVPKPDNIFYVVVEQLTRDSVLICWYVKEKQRARFTKA